MIVILSPAKSLDLSPIEGQETSSIRTSTEVQVLINVLKKKSVKELEQLMRISNNLAELNNARYQHFQEDYHLDNSKAAMFAFDGDVYRGLDALSLTKDEVAFAQQHVRILSGLYGLLRPLDLIQPYRLEMGTKLKIRRANDLYEFWKKKIYNFLVSDLQEIDSKKTILNLASNEYFKAIKPYISQGVSQKKIELIDVDFLDEKNGVFKIISFYAKKARGLMTRYIIQNKITDVNKLPSFDAAGYEYDVDRATPTKLVFKRSALKTYPVA